jgi:hypothetical protein
MNLTGWSERPRLLACEGRAALPGPVLVTVKGGKLTLHRAKGCRSRTFSAGQTFLEYGPEDVNLTHNETGGVTETVVTFLLPVGAPITVDAPAPSPG